MLTSTRFILFSLGPVVAVANLLGPRFPPPIDVTSAQSLLSKAWQNLAKKFQDHINGSSLLLLLDGIENITFLLGAFSLYDPNAASALQIPLH